MKIVTLILLVFSMNLTFGQKLNGKWLMTKEGDTYSYPTNLIMEIKNDSIIYYDFDEFYTSTQIDIKNHKIIMDSDNFEKFEFINDDRLKLFLKVKTDEIYSNLTTEYVRLLPTKTTLTIEQIENLSFNFNWNGEKFKVIFNRELGNLETKEILKMDELTKIRLEELDSTLFISIYNSGKREIIIPIKKVSNNEMILYGTPRKPYEMISEKFE
ncbi:hypothetical protein [Gillisia sp. CAL575]|uniref:hypothetical protein n=1 Tax=Gillisia sp. CAL575 TaxID=985255 RepID=UPI0003A36713|nr:hypothetical protein [Gillisia sp. CAL575]